MWNAALEKASQANVGLTNDNRYTLWYGLKNGTTQFNLFNGGFAGLPNYTHLMSTDSLPTCCPVTGYRMYKDNSGKQDSSYKG